MFAKKLTRILIATLFLNCFAISATSQSSAYTCDPSTENCSAVFDIYSGYVDPYNGWLLDGPITDRLDLSELSVWPSPGDPPSEINGSSEGIVFAGWRDSNGARPFLGCPGDPISNFPDPSYSAVIGIWILFSDSGYNDGYDTYNACSEPPPSPTSDVTLTYNANSPTSGSAPSAVTVSPESVVTIAENSGNLVKSNYIFTGWNTATDGTGTQYQPFETINLYENSTLYAQWILATSPHLELYLDAPLVQGSYAKGRTGASTEDFNSYSDSCSDSAISVGQINGTCSYFNSIDLGATSSDSVTAVGGSGSTFITGYPGASYEVNFPTKEKYIGFWWAAGSPGNQVEFLSSGQVVATMSINQVFAKFGNAPVDDTSYANSSATLTAIDGATNYPKKYYFGNPDGYTSTSPTVKSSVVPDEPFVYIHAFALNGANFDGVRFSGSGFEIDNLTVSTKPVQILGKLVSAENIAATYSDPAVLTYNAYFEPQNGTNVDPQVYSAANPITLPASGIKTGYTFKGWFTQVSGGILVGQPNATYAPDALEDITLYGHWHLNTFVVSYNSMGGSAVANGATSPGDSILAAPETPTLSRYSFMGWLETTTASSVVTFPYAHGKNSPFTLYAKWEAIVASSYAVNFYSDGGMFTDNTTIQTAPAATPGIDALSIKPGNPIRAGYSFLGWSTDSTTVLTSYPLNADTDFHAVWAQNYRVTFYSSPGEFSDSTTVQIAPSARAGINAFSIAPSAPIRSDYSFIGWSLDSATVLDSFTLNADVVFYPVWQRTHTVNFYSNGGIFSDTTTLQSAPSAPHGINAFSIAPGDPTRTGYRFLGWSTDTPTVSAIETARVLSSYELLTDVNFYAVWGSSTRTHLAINSPQFDAHGRFAVGEQISETVTVYVGPSPSTVKLPDNRGFVEFAFFEVDTVTAEITRHPIRGCTLVPVVNGAATCNWIPKTPASEIGLMRLYADFIPLDDSIYIASDLLTDASVVVPASGGGSSSPQFPGITWDPNDLVSGDPITVSNQLDAVFSVPGSAVYSAHPGDVPAVGTLNIRVTFTPADTTNYFAISTTKSIRISPKPTPSPSARSGGGGSAPSPSATPTSSPSPIASPSPSPSMSASTSPSPSPVATSSSKPDKLPTPNNSPSPAAPTTQKPKTVSFTSLKLVGVIHFNNNEYFLDQGDRRSLVSFSREITATSPTQIIVQGNTDIKAGVDNVWLSKARAEAVSKYLAPLLSKSIVISAWFASKKPVAIGLDKASLAKNRRVDIYALVPTASPAPTPQHNDTKQGPVEESYKSISFNRNEYFLDAADRKALVETVQSMAKLGCTQVYLKGSHDKTKSSVNAYIGANRVNAVKKFMAGLLPTLKFSIEPEFVSADRVVQIRCTN